MPCRELNIAGLLVKRGAMREEGLAVTALDHALQCAARARVARASDEVVLACLTPAERTELAQRAAELGVGGDPSLLLIVGIVLLLAILLYLPMAGRMQGWW